MQGGERHIDWKRDCGERANERVGSVYSSCGKSARRPRNNDRRACGGWRAENQYICINTVSYDQTQALALFVSTSHSGFY